MTTFAQEVDAALETAKRDAHPFVPSRAQQEDALAPLVGRLLRRPDAEEYIRASHRGAGTMDVVAVNLFKQAREA